MPQNTVTHFPGGISDVSEGDPMAGLGFPDPTKFITFFMDFAANEQNGMPIATSGLAAAGTVASGWVITVTEAGAGNAATAKLDGVGGLFTFTCDAADNDNIFVQSRYESFKWSATKKMFFETRFKVSDATESDLVIGLQITDTTPLDVTDGLFFIKADGSTSIDFRVEKNDTGSTGSAGTLVTDTFIVLSFFYDPDTTRFLVYADGVLTSTVATTNAVDDEELAISFGIQNGEAVAKVLTLDYILAMQER